MKMVKAKDNGYSESPESPNDPIINGNGERYRTLPFLNRNPPKEEKERVTLLFFLGKTDTSTKSTKEETQQVPGAADI